MHHHRRNIVEYPRFTSFLLSVSVCLSVCLSVCMYAHLSTIARCCAPNTIHSIQSTCRGPGAVHDFDADFDGLPQQHVSMSEASERGTQFVEKDTNQISQWYVGQKAMTKDQIFFYKRLEKYEKKHALEESKAARHIKIKPLSRGRSLIWVRAWFLSPALCVGFAWAPRAWAARRLRRRRLTCCFCVLLFLFSFLFFTSCICSRSSAPRCSSLASGATTPSWRTTANDVDQN